MRLFQQLFWFFIIALFQPAFPKKLSSILSSSTEDTDSLEFILQLDNSSDRCVGIAFRLDQTLFSLKVSYGRLYNLTRLQRSVENWQLACYILAYQRSCVFNSMKVLRTGGLKLCPYGD